MVCPTPRSSRSRPERKPQQRRGKAVRFERRKNMSQKLVQRVEQKENDMKTLERVREPNKIPIQAPAIPPKRIIAATNVIERFLLRSPLHFLLSNTMMLLTYTGRK